MKCVDIMSKNLEWLTEGDSVLAAANVMAEAGIGFLPVCDASRRVLGVVTDRDLTTRALTKKLPPEATPAAQIMSSPVITCLETSDVHEAEELMARERKSRLVIVDADGRLTGVLSLADLVENAPRRESLDTVRAVLWREALGPRGGAGRNDPLLKDDPAAHNQPPPSEHATAHPSVFTGGHRGTGTKEFPG